MNRFKCSVTTILLVLIYLSPLSAAYSEIYRWKDAGGKLHYGDRPANKNQATEVEITATQSTWKPYHIEINDIDHVLTVKERQQINHDVNTIYRFFNNKLYFDIYKTVPVKIRLYEKEKDYVAYIQGHYHYYRAHETIGMYFSKSNEIVVFINPHNHSRTFSTIAHETSHAIVDTLMPYLPAWLNEGLAENMETLKENDDEFHLDLHPYNFKTANKFYQQGRAPGIEHFLKMKNAVWRASNNSGNDYFYQAFAGELVKMLLVKPVGKSFLTRLLHSYKRGTRTFSAYIADEHYIGGLTTLQYDWEQWITRKTLTTYRL